MERRQAQPDTRRALGPTFRSLLEQLEDQGGHARVDVRCDLAWIARRRVQVVASWPKVACWCRAKRITRIVLRY